MTEHSLVTFRNKDLIQAALTHPALPAFGLEKQKLKDLPGRAWAAIHPAFHIKRARVAVTRGFQGAKQ